MESSCIQRLDLSNGLTTTELERFDCLKVCVDHNNIDMYKIITNELILTLFKAVQQLQTEIDNI